MFGVKRIPKKDWAIDKFISKINSRAKRMISLVFKVAWNLNRVKITAFSI